MKKPVGTESVPVKNSIVLIGQDLHLWPENNSTALRGFRHVAKFLNPDVLILNGDVMDIPQVSRHPPIGWEHHPDLLQELEYAKVVLGGLEELVGANTKLFWTLGNHDSRFNTRLAEIAPEYRGIPGFRLKDHFSARWTPAWRVDLVSDKETTIVKHRFSGGIHAAYNNVIKSARHFITGHTHRLGARPVVLDQRTFWGVEAGMLNDPNAPQFSSYTEAAPLHWAAGFVVLNYRNGLLLPPELVSVLDEEAGTIVWNGTIIEV
jgi:hypothetical protein